MNSESVRFKWLILFAVVVITFICFSGALHNQFTSWDDDSYITQNKYITSLSATNLKALFTKAFVANWQPLTMLSYAANYHYSQLQPEGYYLTNILIHLLNVCLVYFLAVQLFEAMQKRGYEEIKYKYIFAALCTLWFGVHPMHVESVAWASERKDVLYTCFYFLSLIFYIQYIEVNKVKWMLFVFISFFLSCLCKPMAVVLPLSLLTIDVLLKRELKLKLIIEKVPLFLLSLGMGCLAIYEQRNGGAVTSFNVLTLGERFMFPAYGFMLYTIKLILPIGLTSYYPYPDLSGVALPAIFYIAPIIAIALVVVPLYMAYKKGGNTFRIIVFGMGFYLANLVFVLQFISVGKTIMAERYSYVSYFGLFFMLLYFAFIQMQKTPSLRVSMQVILTGFSLVFCIECAARTKAWHNSETLWRDVANTNPLKVGEAYESLGNYYYFQGDMDSAYNNYKILSTIYFKDPYVFNRLGNIDIQKQDYEHAIVEFSHSLQIDSNYYFSLMDRAGIYSRMTKFQLALADYNHAYHINPNDEQLLLKRGTVELNMGNITTAITDFTRVLSINPENSTCTYIMSLAYKKNKDYPNALRYAIKAKNMGYQVPDAYISNLRQQAN